MITADAIFMLLKQMGTEDKILVLSELITSMFECNDFDVGLALYEKRYQLEQTEDRKKTQAGLIEFLREVNTLRPHAKKFFSLIQSQLKEKGQ